MVDLTTRAPVLVRLRQEVVGDAGRTVHLIPPPGSVVPSGVVGALCRVSLAVGQVETAAPGVEMPCTRCLLPRRRAAASVSEDVSSSHPARA
jgi:hypothetical protein